MKYLKSFECCKKEEWTGNLFTRPQCNRWKFICAGKCAIKHGFYTSINLLQWPFVSE